MQQITHSWSGIVCLLSFIYVFMKRRNTKRGEKNQQTGKRASFSPPIMWLSGKSHHRDVWIFWPFHSRRISVFASHTEQRPTSEQDKATLMSVEWVWMNMWLTEEQGGSQNEAERNLERGKDNLSISTLSISLFTPNLYHSHSTRLNDSWWTAESKLKLNISSFDDSVCNYS